VQKTLLLPAFLLFPLLVSVTAAQGGDAPAADGLGRWYAEWNRLEAFWGEGGETDYATLLRASAVEAPLSRARMVANGVVLLDLASWGLSRRPVSSDYVGGGDRHRMRRRARQTLDGLIDRERGRQMLDWMADEVLALRSTHPVPRRLLALELCSSHRTESGKLAMLTIGRDLKDPLRAEVLDVLSTWPDEAVDLFLVGLIGRKFDKNLKPHPFNLLLQRIHEVEVPLGTRATDLLVDRLRITLLSTDWREASRSIELSRGMEPKHQVPLLLDALSAWTRREKSGGGSRRILNDVVRELQRISGLSVGRNPKNWITWWIAVRQGRAQIADPNYIPDEPRTHATFFGLRPVTDQVTFVIDYSGSMATEWGTSEHSRYVEAIEQMMRFLQAAGPETRFNVILFSDQPLRSSPHLIRATPRNLSRARDSLLKREPGGGTFLRPAVELALRLDSKGDVDADRLQADTIIVLCDGETGEGKGWVAPLIDRVNGEARVNFHTVLIGHRGDGTLESLSERSGGDFLAIGG